MIVVASLFCDRKASSWTIGLPSMLGQDFVQPWRFYANIESNYPHDDPNGPAKYAPIFNMLNRSSIPFDYDIWSMHTSWWAKPTFDQDQSRLTPIVYARNMALNYARSTGASHILFIDADVTVPPSALSMLERAGKALVGGVVPGRGVHRHARYIFGATNNWEGQLQECTHGTLGCMLIRKDVFDYLSFRFGPAYKAGTMLSEDPAYCNDAAVFLGQKFWIHHGVQCQHWDDPDKPLTEQEVARF